MRMEEQVLALLQEIGFEYEKETSHGNVMKERNQNKALIAMRREEMKEIVVRVEKWER